MITGNTTSHGGNMTAHSLNGTLPDTILTFGPAKNTIHNQYVHHVQATFGKVLNVDHAIFATSFDACDIPCAVIE